MFWFRRNKAFKDYRYCELPGKAGTVIIPSEFKIELEDDATLLAYPTGPESIILRFITFSAASNEGEHLGEEHVRDKAIEKNTVCYELNGKVVINYEKEPEGQGKPFIHLVWEVGVENNIILVSAQIPKNMQKNPLVKMTLASIQTILDSIKITINHEEIEVGGKTLEVTGQAYDEPWPQTLKPFGAEEEKWLATNVEHARELGLKYGSDGELDPEELDRIFLRWIDEEINKENDDWMVNALGAAFGSWLVQEHDFRWTVVDDNSGSEYGVRHHICDAIAYPLTSVRTQLKRRQNEYFADLLLIILDGLKEAKKHESDR